MKVNCETRKCCEDEGEHMMRDCCWNCAPWWYEIKICPEHKSKLGASGYCKNCKKFYNVK